MDEKNCFNEYIVSRDFLGEHKREHYDLKGDEVIFSSDPYVTFGDIYDNAVPLVRCGECERRVKSADLTDSVLCRWLHNLQMPKNGYCCYGERSRE